MSRVTLLWLHMPLLYLPTRRMGRGPNLSIRMPSGSVVALSRKEPMVKPKFSISSWSTQLSHSSTSLLEDELPKDTTMESFSVRGVRGHAYRRGTFGLGAGLLARRVLPRYWVSGFPL